MHQNPSTRKVSTEWGIFHICEECWAAHPIPEKFLKPKFLIDEDSDGRPCECEHVSHFDKPIEISYKPFNPDGGEL
jgi:hypothetical protein